MILLNTRNEVIGNTAPQEHYAGLQPWLHACGVPWWVIDPVNGQPFPDADGTMLWLRRRELAEIQATSEYAAWLDDHPADLPKLYVTLAISGGDNGNPPGINLSELTQSNLNLTGDVRLNPAEAASIVLITKAWRFTLRKVISELVPTPVDSVVKVAALDNGQITLTLTVTTPGIWSITDADFDPIRAADFPALQLPSDFQVVLVGGAKFFKVYSA